MAATVTLRWSKLAKGDLQAAWDVFPSDNAQAADALVDRIIGASEALERHPHMGRTGRVRGTRELVIPATPCILTYRMKEQTLIIVALTHGARKWPENF